ncbi:MAG: zf-HC2 domain-containing protein [Firmicutes bacterium]|nr:zf-HC2 domain-containing protein [Bacillota bacterium]MDH7495994.1 zf-HC2 domain-containing protein [Bacillota bacterium]
MGGFIQRKRSRLRCRDLQRAVLAYAEEGLGGPEREVVEAHIRTCETCRQAAEHLREVTLAVRALRSEPPAALDAAQIARLARRRAEEGRGLRSLAAKVSRWADDVIGPVVECPAEALVASGLVLWLAAAGMAHALSLNQLAGRLAALALVRVGLPGF